MSNNKIMKFHATACESCVNSVGHGKQLSKLSRTNCFNTRNNCYFLQEAQLPQRDSASATHVFLGSLTDRALH